MFGLLSSINYQTISMLAIVCGLVVLCLGMWYLWTTQQQMQTDLQFMQMQCTQLAATSAPALPSSSASSPKQCASPENGTCALPTSSPLSNMPALDSVLHRSMTLMQAANDVQNRQQQGDDDEDDDEDDDDSESCSDDYDDDDTAVSETMVQQTHSNSSPADDTPNATTSSPATDSATVSDANLVESLLSNIVTETIDAQMQHEPSPPQQSQEQPPTSDASAEDFITNQGDPSKLAATLQQKTVNELKKICAEYQIGTKKGKGYKRKEELIDDIVKVKVGAGALE